MQVNGLRGAFRHSQSLSMTFLVRLQPRVRWQAFGDRVHKRHLIGADRASDDEEFNQIDSSLAPLDLGHERLRLPEALCKVRLPQPGPSARINQHAEQYPIGFGEDGARH